MEKQKVRRIEVTGELGEGVTAKDVILAVIRKLGTDGGVGYVYEYGGPAIEEMEMAGRMSICNMSIEGGARAGTSTPTRPPTTTSRAARRSPRARHSTN